MALTPEEYSFWSRNLLPTGEGVTLGDLRGIEGSNEPGVTTEDYYNRDPNFTANYDYTGGIPDLQGKNVQVVQPGVGVKDDSKVFWEPKTQTYVTESSNTYNEGGGVPWKEFLILASLGVGAAAIAAYAGVGATTQTAMLAEQYMGLGYTAEEASTLAAMDAAGAGGSSIAAGAPLTQSEMLAAQEMGFTSEEIAAWQSTQGSIPISQVAQTAMKNPLVKTAVSKAISALTSGQGDGSGRQGDGSGLGQMLTGGVNAWYQNKLADEGVQKAEELAKGIQFKPYAISSPLGRTYQDPTTGEMRSELSPEAGMMNQELMNQFMGNMQYATMDPMEASQYAYNMGSQLNAYQDEQNRLGLENRLLAQGMLGSTGGGTQMRSLYDAMNQRDLGREAQSLGLGQQMLSQYQQRGLNAYQPMLQTQAALANQLGQSGQFGNLAQQGQFAGANLINQANLARMKVRSGTATGFANNPALQNGIDQFGNWIGNNAGNWLSGDSSGINWGSQNDALLNQQGDFNWSGQEGVYAGSDQDMMLNDQWDWSWG